MEGTFHGFRELSAGGVSLLYRDGEIRQIDAGRFRVLNGIYPAVRDRNWGTVRGVTEKEDITRDSNGIRIRIVILYMQEEIRFRSELEYRVTDGGVDAFFRGKAESSFMKNRIGLNVLLHPPAGKGVQVTVRHSDGTLSRNTLEARVSPHQPVMDITGMEWTAGDRIGASLEFRDGVFEMEDQRNWSDASLKIYTPPLSVPFPAQIAEGEEVVHAVRLSIRSGEVIRSGEAIRRGIRQHRIRLTSRGGKGVRLPAIGVGSAQFSGPLTIQEAGPIGSVGFQHLRTDLFLYKNEWKKEWDKLIREQIQLRLPLELALHFGREERQEWATFLNTYNRQPLPLSRLLIYDRSGMTGADLASRLSSRIRRTMHGVPLGGGTDAYFAELNRHPPLPGILDFVTFTICPQVHGFDNLTLVENLPVQGTLVRQAKEMLGLPVAVTFVALRQRFNVVATDDTGDRAPERDQRQHTLFAAGWTLGSIRALSEAGAESVTFFETAGPGGIIRRGGQAAEHSPLFHLFREILSGREDRVLPVEPDASDRVSPFLLSGPGGTRLLLANHTGNPIRVDFSALSQIFSERSAMSLARLTPSGWEILPYNQEKIGHLSLEPYSILRLRSGVDQN